LPASTFACIAAPSARRAADYHDAFDVLDRKAGVAQRLAHRSQGLLYQGLGDAAEGFCIQGQIHHVAGGELRGDRRLAVEGQLLLSLARLHLQQPHVARPERRELGVLDRPAEHALVEIVAAEHRVAAGSHYLEYAARELQDR
jgi:hypothetical protein